MRLKEIEGSWRLAIATKTILRLLNRIEWEDLKVCSHSQRGVALSVLGAALVQIIAYRNKR
jgi:hypothetical protein